MTTEDERDDVELTPSADEAAEEKAFNARIDSLVPEAGPTPLETKVEDKPEGAEAAGAGDGEDAPALSPEAAAVAREEISKSFALGEFTEEEAVALLKRVGELEGIEDRVEEKVASRVFGKFGEVNRKLEELQGKELEFDPEALAKLKDVDEALHDALVESLPKALKGRQVDVEAMEKSISDRVSSLILPAVEQRLMESLAPDATQVVRTEGFRKWYFDVAPQSVRDLFEAWDAGTKLDGIGMGRAILDYKAHEEKIAADAAAKKEALRMSADKDKKSPATPSTRKSMDEDEAFAARVRETTGLRH